MDWSTTSLWWVAAGVVVAAELATGTFYLLMVALGMVAAALASMLGVPLSTQVITAAVVGGGATAIWHWRRGRQPPAVPLAENSDVNFDVGERIHVEAWGPDGTARVAYRGSTWTARLAPDAAPAPGLHLVSAVEGNWLVLRPAPGH